MKKFSNLEEKLISRHIQTDVDDWTVDEFVKTIPYEENRAVDRRIDTVMSHIKIGLPTIYEVKVFYFMKDCGGHAAGTMAKFDGNARSYIWENYPELRNGNMLKVTIYFVRDIDEARMLYDSVDSLSSAESKSDKVTGYLRKMQYTAKTTKFRKGHVNTALRISSRFVRNEHGVHLMNSTLNDKMGYFWKLLIYLDEMGVYDGKKSSNNVISTLLLVGKKYGVENMRFQELVFNFMHEIPEITSKLSSDEIVSSEDGVTYVYNTLFSNNTKEWRNDSFESIKESNEPLNCRILYSFDCFMKGIRIKKRGRKPMSNSDFYKFWMTYLK